MPDQWWMVFDGDTGRSVSLGTTVAAALALPLMKVALSQGDAEVLLSGLGRWDEPTRSVVLRAADVPAEVTRWQFRRWLVDHGITPDSVESLIESSLADPLERARALVDWRDGPIVRRSHPLLVPMAAALGLTESQVDAAFVAAAQYQ